MEDATAYPPSEFDAEFRTFAFHEARTPAPRNAVLFYGSSSIRFWLTLSRDFPTLTLVNRGFGGSTLVDCIQQLDRLVFPLQPKAIVLYAGENDLDQGAAPEVIPALFGEFANRVLLGLGPVPIIFISIKPSLARGPMIEKIQRTNSLMREAIARCPNAHFLEVFSLMLESNGTACRGLFTEDGLHMSRAGYQLWTSLLRPRLVELGLT